MRDPRLRKARLEETIRELLSQLLLREAKDPRLAGVVISAVELSGDLRQAKAYFSVFGDAERERQAAEGLEQAKGFLRAELRRSLRADIVPELVFLRDKGYERADRVSQLLHQLHRAGQGEGGGE
ncbi:MAG: 30S ribosome-binding factor RbfA [Thermoanaerobaculum sp.]|nr:30S ribosome-binding factor RbfA [Thermoanaerobaculum sp.]MDW7967577.1 30S ribosome-binding factor RbfA [Thermoanaerobaculum sp.]